MSIETVRISEKAKRQLIVVKQKTGIEQWNVLCRWAFCISLADKNLPSPAIIPLDSNVEMTWKTFGGEYEQVYMGLLKHRCDTDRKNDLAEQFKLHLHRGINALSSYKL